MPGNRRLEGNVAIITGGTQGIGEAVTRLFVAEGSRVLLIARTPDAGQALMEELGRDVASFLEGDVSDPATADRAVRAALDVFGGLDILINNAAVDLSGVSLVETEPNEIARVFEVNTYGSVFMMQAAIRHMKTTGRGVIVNVISRAGLVGIPGMAIYGASKGAVAILTKASAAELTSSGIRVNAVAPGATETPMMRSWIDEQPDPSSFERGIVSDLLGGRLAQPEEIAEAILFLASPASSYMTGACLAVDGGYTAM